MLFKNSYELLDGYFLILPLFFSGNLGAGRDLKQNEQLHPRVPCLLFKDPPPPVENERWDEPRPMGVMIVVVGLLNCLVYLSERHLWIGTPTDESWFRDRRRGLSGFLCLPGLVPGGSVFDYADGQLVEGTGKITVTLVCVPAPSHKIKHRLLVELDSMFSHLVCSIISIALCGSKSPLQVLLTRVTFDPSTCDVVNALHLDFPFPDGSKVTIILFAVGFCLFAGKFSADSSVHGSKALTVRVNADGARCFDGQDPRANLRSS